MSPAQGRVAVFADAHAHAEAFDAVVAAAGASGVDALWSLGDMVGGGPDPETSSPARASSAPSRCSATTTTERRAPPSRPLRAEGSPAARSIELARERLDDDALAWMRTRRPAARRGDVQCWHGSPRNPVHEFVGASNAGACLAVQKGSLGLVGHTHAAAAWLQTPRGAKSVRVRVGEPLDLSEGRWLLNPGAVGAPVPPRRGWWDGLDAAAAEGAFWLLLDLDARSATWRRAPYDPAPARVRARGFGLD